jgi:nanoRNase/pAp phosphatase (c-di-AMP/oligoRNAs hydrolase)
MREITEFLTSASKRGQRILVLCHHNADPDAVGSSIALSDALKQLGAQVEVGVSESLSRAAQAVLKAAGREITINPKLDADIIVLVDTSSFEHLGKLGEEIRQRAPELVLIDHHRPVEEMRQFVKHYFVREEAASESELILALIQGLGAELTSEIAFLLLAGIVSDTGQFRLAKPTTFQAVDALVRAGADYRRVLEALKLPEDMSKRIAMLKAAQRVKLHRIDDRLIAFSELSSFEADAAVMLVRIGADVAVVGSEEKGKIRLCGRAREELLETTHLHLGELMSELAKHFKGTGGGHAGAASMTGEGELIEAQKRLLQILRRMLESKGVSTTK